MPSAASSLPAAYRTALVTGASSGLGKAFAEAFLTAGLTVYGTSRQPDPDPMGPSIRWLPFDGGSKSGLEAFLREQRELLSSIDVLVNNSGSAFFGKAFQDDPLVVSEQLTLLLEAPAGLTAAALPGMRKRGHGAVVNVSSLATLFPLPYMAAYSAGKAGLSAFTQSLMISERGTGVVFLDLQLGDIRTAFNRNMQRSEPESGGEEAAWRKTEAHLENAPQPEVAVRDLFKALRRGRSGIVRSGGIFQTRVALLGPRFLPRSVLLACIRKYFGIPAK